MRSFLLDYPISILTFFACAYLLAIACLRSCTPEEPPRFGLRPEPITSQIYDVPLPVNEPHPTAAKKSLQPMLVGVRWEKVSTYSPDSDGGKPDRKTAGNTLWDGNHDYPDEYRTLRYTIENQIGICAIPWKDKWIHEELIEYGRDAEDDPIMFHRYLVRFPWYDPPGFYRYPIDRVPYRGKNGSPLPQRSRFDMFMHMPGKQALKHGVYLGPVEVFEMVEVEQ